MFLYDGSSTSSGASVSQCRRWSQRTTEHHICHLPKIWRSVPGALIPPGPQTNASCQCSLQTGWSPAHVPLPNFFPIKCLCSLALPLDWSAIHYHLAQSWNQNLSAPQIRKEVWRHRLFHWSTAPAWIRTIKGTTEWWWDHECCVHMTTVTTRNNTNNTQES